MSQKGRNVLKIALFVGQIYIYTQREIIKGIYEECKKNNDELHLFSIYISDDPSFDQGEFEYLKRMDFKGFDAFILYASAFYEPAIREDLIYKIKSYNKPKVSIDDEIDGFKNITSCNYDAMKELVEHLITEHNTRIINFVGGPSDSKDAQDRLQACIDALNDHGLKLDPFRIYTGNYYIESGIKAYNYFKENDLMDADAFVCVNDHSAMGVYFEMEKDGFKIPEKYKITGFDNIPRAAYNIPSITSINRSERKIGSEAYKALFSKDNDVIKIKPVLSKGTSCCKNAVMDPEEQQKQLKRFVKLSIDNSKYAAYINDSVANFTTYKTLREMYMALPDYQKKFDIPTMNIVLDKRKRMLEISYHYKLTNDSQIRLLQNRNEAYYEEGDGNLYVYSSLHYGNRYFGYVITTNYMGALENELYHTFINSIAIMYESVNKYEQQEAYINKLMNIGYYDSLTKLLNRTGFFNKTDIEFTFAKKNNKNSFIIFADLDGLKLINDNLDHKMGDEYIKDFAGILNSCINDEDIAMRYGGDEFVVFGVGKSKDNIENMILDINQTINAFNRKNKYAPYSLSVSTGYSIIPPDTDKTLAQHIEIADKRMYEAKKEKKSGLVTNEKRHGDRRKGDRRSGRDRRIADRRGIKIELD